MPINLLKKLGQFMDRLSDKKKIKSNRGKLFDSKIQSKVTKLHEHPQKSNSRRHGAKNLPSLISDTNPNPMFAKPETMEPKQKNYQKCFFLMKTILLCMNLNQKQHNFSEFTKLKIIFQIIII